MHELVRLARGATRWFLRRRGPELEPSVEAEHFAPGIRALNAGFDGMLEGSVRERWQERFGYFIQAGVPAPIARQAAGTVHLYTALGVMSAATCTGQSEGPAAKVLCTPCSTLQFA